jgi:PA domain
MQHCFSPWRYLAFLFQLLLLLLSSSAGDKINAALHASAHTGAVQHVEFCIGCPDPRLEGSHIRALNALHGLKEFAVTGDIVYAVPNDGSSPLLNADELAGHIALLDRGTVPLLEKITLAQKAGATAVLIVDNGQCSEDFMQCGRTGGVPEGGYSYKDSSYQWSKITVPALMVSKSQGDRIKSLMNLRTVTVSGLGVQSVHR